MAHRDDREWRRLGGICWPLLQLLLALLPTLFGLLSSRGSVCLSCLLCSTYAPEGQGARVMVITKVSLYTDWFFRVLVTGN